MSAVLTDNKAPILKIPPCQSYDEWCTCYRDSPPSLNTLRRAFTALIRWAFSNPESMDGYADVLRCLTYSPDKSASKISINPGSTVDPGDTENVPGILIKADGGVTFAQVGLNPVSYESDDTASWNQTMVASTDITILCRNYDADVCCVMADMCLLFLFSMYQRLLETWGWLLAFGIKSQSEPKLTQQQGEDVTKWYESNVIVTLTYEYSTYVARESKRLKDFTIDSTPS